MAEPVPEPVPGKVYRQHRFTLPQGATDLLVIRHGESMPGRVDDPFDTWRSADPPRDHADPPLAPEGEQQAMALAQRLVATAIDAIYVTPLRRTMQTIAPYAEKAGLIPVVEPDLVEVHLGEWEGVLWRARAEERDPLAVRAFTEQRWDVVPGAEPAAELAARVRRGITRIAGAHPDQRVIVVVHGGVIGQIFALATGCQPFAFTGADNASISRLFVHGDRWLARGFNDVAHLDAADGVIPSRSLGWE